MRIIPKRRRHRKSHTRLQLRVDVIQAKDLVISDAKSCNMVAGIAFNGRQLKRTNKIKRTANPTWNSSHKLTLTGYPVNSPNIHIAVFDKHKRYSNYLGELRLSVNDLFEDPETGELRTKVAPKWFSLHSSKSQNLFATGSIKVGFELLSKSDTIMVFKQWQSTLVNKKPIGVDDQYYYSDTETDVESLLAKDQNDVKNDILLDDMKKIDMHGSSNSGSRVNLLELHSSQLNYSSYDSNYSSDVSISEGPHLRVPQEFLRRSSANKAIRRMKSFRDGIAGVVTLEIISASGLPPFRNLIKKSYDMDPFVVISFGKKTYRTSWRKHTLKPVFNECLAFEVLAKETNYDLFFNILDKDHFSFHDKVASGSITLSEIIHEDDFVDYDLKLKLYKESDHDPVLKFRIQFQPYSDLKSRLWKTALIKHSINGKDLDIVQLTSFLEDANIEENLVSFYTANDKSMEEPLTFSEINKVLEKHSYKLDRCPICQKRKQTDMAVHVAICSSKGDRLKSFATAGFASKRWYSKVLIKFAYGKYAYGKNNANILVQDRDTGFVIEEKMSLYVRLGIRLLYKGKGADTKRIKNALRNLSIKQGSKFDHPNSVKDIDSFVKFHALDLSECEDVEYKSFNEFFYRKLKPGSRPPESQDPRVIVSPADSRCTTFRDVDTAKKLWIKGRTFTVQKLLDEGYDSTFENCSVAIFRLAPQDYHRFHSPVDGVVGEPLFIQGEYYTVNPMAIRSDLDVFGDNVRVVVPIDTKEFGRVMFVSIGAMMVGSTVLTVNEGDTVKRSDELGYFKFGGSTIVTLFQKDCMSFDSDLLTNSHESMETLVRVGMSVGHRDDIGELSRDKIAFDDVSEDAKLRVIRSITGGLPDHPWEFLQLNVRENEDLESEEEDEEEEGDEEDEEGEEDEYEN